MVITRLPTAATKNENHVPVLTSTNLSTANRVIVYIGESCQDLGIFAYRLIGSGTISSGSALDFVHHVKATSRDNAAVVVANPGQLIWHRRGKQAMTQHTWHAIPRETAVSQPMRVDVVRNRVPNNQGIQQHIACVFEEVVDQMTHKDAKIDIIGMGDGALEVVEYLQQDWGKWGGRVDAIAVGASHIWQTDIRDERFGKFWGRRGRAYLISSEDIDTPLTGREGFLCNCYSSGEPSHMELILTSAYKSMLDYFKVVAENPDYEALPQNSSSEQGIEEKDANGGTGEKGW
ncbi:hypothetical protein MMC13_003231 [Lambiella insularis]|nr:hypothetical protein [Lambiella insularis]